MLLKVKVKLPFLRTKCWNRWNRADLIKCTTPCHDAQEVSPYQVLNPLCPTILTQKSWDYTTKI